MDVWEAMEGEGQRRTRRGSRVRVGTSLCKLTATKEMDRVYGHPGMGDSRSIWTGGTGQAELMRGEPVLGGWVQKEDKKEGRTRINWHEEATIGSREIPTETSSL